jgi:hypothetical protein
MESGDVGDMNLDGASSKRPLTQEESDAVAKAQKAFEPIQSYIDREVEKRAEGKSPRTYAAAWDDDEQAWVTKVSGVDEDTDKVRQIGDQIGHKFGGGGYLDGDQESGTANASHAEEKVIVSLPDAPLAEGPTEMCAPCVRFFRKFAMYRNKMQIVAGDKITRIFYTNGKIGIVEGGDVHIFDTPKGAYTRSLLKF